MTMPPPLILDTCVVLSLCATRRVEEILGANAGPFLVAEAVLREALYIHVVVDGEREKELISLDSLLAAGVLSVVQPETEEEFQSLVDLSLDLDDGEAMTCALAQYRGYRIATDERKTIRLVGNRIVTVGTLDLVRSWADDMAVPPAQLREVLNAIEDRGYVPGITQVHYAWWQQIVNGDG
jgi:predicted nucleic acid-binding protein